jgi:ATP-binding cassette subfamily F protein 3
MHIIQLKDLSINHAGRLIFKDLSWSIGDRDRIGLIGPNGVGKSSLVKAIVGEVEPSAGMITRARGLRVGYLPQHPNLTPGRRLIDEAMIKPPALAAVEDELSAVEASLADPDVYNDADKLARALAQQEKILERWEALGGTRFENKIREMLAHLGFTPDDHELQTEALSGGQKKLVTLVKLAAEQPDLLLLDEPDNHLDLEAKRRLESFLKAYPGAVVIVSHDRYLLDEVVDWIAELDNPQPGLPATLTMYKGNYSAYAVERELRRLRQQQMYVAQQKRITQFEEAIKQFEYIARQYESQRANKQARSRRKMLERMEANGEIIEKVTERRQLTLNFEGGRGSTKAIETKHLAMAFDDNLIFDDINLLVHHGERVGLVGPNGAGKSVLFKLLTGELTPFEGEVKIGNSTRVGYYAQEHQTLAPWWDKTPIDFVRDVAPSAEGSAVSFLLRFLFTYEQTRQPIGTLSGGERSRLQLAALMLSKPNLLLLDEPTNNLDIASSEVLEAALNDFEGAVVVISHDRYFLDQVVDRVVELDNGRLRSFVGGYTDYLEARNRPTPVRARG